MTFIVGSDGVIYQKDLGKTTSTLVKTMKSYNPDSTWQKADIDDDAVASTKKQK